MTFIRKLWGCNISVYYNTMQLELYVSCTGVWYSHHLFWFKYVSSIISFMRALQCSQFWCSPACKAADIQPDPLTWFAEVLPHSAWYRSPKTKQTSVLSLEVRAVPLFPIPHHLLFCQFVFPLEHMVVGCPHQRFQMIQQCYQLRLFSDLWEELVLYL